MSTLAERKRIADLMEKGNDPTVGYYYSACVICGNPALGSSCADPKGFALIGKLGTPSEAYNRFTEMARVFPDSNPSCVKYSYILALLLEADPFLVLDIWMICCNSHDSYTKREEALADFLRKLRNERELHRIWFVEEMKEYLEKVEALQVT